MVCQITEVETRFRTTQRIQGRTKEEVLVEPIRIRKRECTFLENTKNKFTQFRNPVKPLLTVPLLHVSYKEIFYILCREENECGRNYRNLFRK